MSRKKVFVLTAVHDHEGTDLVGVYATRKGAEDERDRQEKLKKRVRKRWENWDGESEIKSCSPFENCDWFSIEETYLKGL
jgi:poly(3-hydroxybutyrate) depolymerase